MSKSRLGSGPQWGACQMLCALVAVLIAISLGCGEDDATPRPDDVAHVDLDSDVGADTSDDGDTASVDAEIVDCEGVDCDAGDCPAECIDAPTFLYDPAAGYLHAYPDDFFAEPDGDSPTGIRVRLAVDSVAHLAEAAPEDLVLAFREIDGLDGFGTSGGAIFRFTLPLDRETIGSGEETAAEGSAVIFGYLGDSGFVRLPVETVYADDDTTVILWPMVPLPRATRAIAGLTRTVRGVDGTAIEPNEVLSTLLDGSAGSPMDRMVPRVGEAVAALTEAGAIDSVADLGALTVFTTQSIVTDSAAVAADVRGREHVVKERLGCSDESTYRLCTVLLEAGHYRNADGLFELTDDGGPQELYDLTVSVYLPLDSADVEGPPYPAVLFGHGISATRSQAYPLARRVAPLGIATVSIDAPEHGAHPVRQNTDAIVSVLDFFGIAGAQAINPGVLRDNLHQAAWDKLAVVKLMLDGLDADGDGLDDIDATQLVYFGASLGAIMGPELLELAPEIGAAVLMTPGARLTDIMQFGESFAPLIQLFKPQSATVGDVTRFWAFVQTALDSADPVAYSPTLIDGRLEGGTPAQILVPMVIDDDTIPEASAFSLIRALGVPQVPPVIRPAGIVPATGPPPIVNNLPGGGTAGALQFDWLYRGTWERATHDNLLNGDVPNEAWIHFITSYFETGEAEIIDAYESLGLERPAAVGF